jgi:hypothetical protein
MALHLQGDRTMQLSTAIKGLIQAAVTAIVPFIAVAAMTPAYAVTLSDEFIVRDPLGNTVPEWSVSVFEGSSENILVTSPVPVDTNQFGNATVLVEPGVDPQTGYSDIFGLVNPTTFAFVSDGDPGLANVGLTPTFILILETGLPVDATRYLDLGLQAQGYTATFQSDVNGVVPLPAALPLFASGLGALGLLGWRRKRKASAIAA